MQSGLTPPLKTPSCPLTRVEKSELIGALRAAWAEAHAGLDIAFRHRDQWPELARDLDQTLSRLTDHLALAEKLKDS